MQRGRYDAGENGAYSFTDRKGGPVMAKKKKKVRTLTEQQYNEYLMALKDERPTVLIDKDGKRVPQK